MDLFFGNGGRTPNFSKQSLVQSGPFVHGWVCTYGILDGNSRSILRPTGMTQGISLAYFIFFLVELGVRIVGEHGGVWWRSSWILFDFVLIFLCLSEAPVSDGGAGHRATGKKLGWLDLRLSGMLSKSLEASWNWSLPQYRKLRHREIT